MSEQVTKEQQFCNCIHKGNMGSHTDDCAIHKPRLPAVAVHAELKQQNKAAIYVRVKVMDSKGDSYYFDVSAFHHDLKRWESV